MRQRHVGLILITVISLFALYVALPISHPSSLAGLLFWQPAEARSIDLHLGLDLRGGLQVLLEADIAPGQVLEEGAMDTAKLVVENRVNGLGVSEALVQVQGDRRIIVELPGISDPDLAINTIKGTGLLEFVELDDLYLEEGTRILTTFDSGQTITGTTGITPTATVTETVGGDSAVPTPYPQVFRTILTGKELQDAGVSADDIGSPVVNFTLKAEGAQIFANYTRDNVGRILGISLDKVILSSPRINGPIPDGNVQITGRFTLQEARSLAVQMRYGALPVPLKVASIRTVSPTLEEQSINRSVTAGVIGLSIILFFMLVYYRLPGSLANVALILYAIFNLAIYKLLPVTMTLPAIAGFLLSTGTAVDANILIFERMKEELRWGRSLSAAIDAGFDRAWTSIRDSNLSTLITCVILYWFGSNFGASIVKGFAVTLFIGVLISMFTAITVTRTLIRFIFQVAGDKIKERDWLLPL